jgi:hypothetical protein
MTEHFYFFSYGSNLLFERIRRRVPSVQVVKNYQLTGFKLCFNKLSMDGSTKANVVPDLIEAYVHGVIHRAVQKEKRFLDEAEALGKGYNESFFEHEIEGKVRKVGFYLANESKYLAEGRPYDWYLGYVVEGAKENSFPITYRHWLESLPYEVDTNSQRRQPHDLVLEMKTRS